MIGLGLGIWGSQSVPAAGGGGGPAAMTWSPTDNSGNVTLSSGNLTATTATAGSGVSTVRASRAISPDLAYWECTPSSVSALIGVADSTAPLSTSIFWGPSAFGYVATSHAAGYFGTDSDIVYNDGFTSVTGFTGGDTIDIAVRVTAKKAWWRKNNGSWLPSGDPAANTGGQDIALIGSTMLPACQGGAATTCAIAARFDSASFLHTPPSGFSAP